MASGTTTLLALFNDIRTLEVPDFQRNYSWGEDQIDDFHNDVKYASKNNRDHFMGSTILMKSKPDDPNDKSYQIIDGQQRLTTIFMFIAIIRDSVISLGETTLKPNVDRGIRIDVPSKANEMLYSNEISGETRFKSNVQLSKYFRDYIFPEPSSSRPRMPKRKEYWSLDLRKAYLRISALIEEDLKEYESKEEKLRYLWELLETFRRRLQILKITTDTYPESFDVFMTLNNRGLALGPSDLVKSLFMKYLTIGLDSDQIVDRNREIQEDWKQITDAIGDGDVDQFLRHYLVGIHDEQVRAKDIFTIIENLVAKDKSLSPEVKSKLVLNDLIRASAIYSQLLQPEKIDDQVIQRHCVTLHQLGDTYRILMLPIMDPDLAIDRAKQRELTKLCEILYIRWVLTGENAQVLEDHFQSICKLLRAKPIDFAKVKTKIQEKIPDDAKCSVQFDFEVSKASLVRTVLYRINSLIGDQGELLNQDPRKLHIEHIAPATATEDWKRALFPNTKDDFAAEYASLVEQWGNKTLLDKPINQSIGQKSFVDKCNGNEKWSGYKGTAISITNDLVNLKEWNPSLIKKRNKWIRYSFMKIWSLNPDTDNVVPFSEWTEQ